MHMTMRYWIVKKVRKPVEYEELDKPVDLVIHTKSPEKWMLIDRETGQTFQGNANGKWDRLDLVRSNSITHSLNK